ncbi:hypothetical protein XM38_005900 [Halomicronema hongdechloris C2206]|uniref:Uncharacterized protein n=1 Tax=Halomicronema hongdechloris C2206 TaxID=1641165 RepID=A0A1Z3HH89_9CYAN|nr:hypothetical protein [Halomicronema hongdechloris]ASC69661.1 hypothetical protein XM38_005900 [Halomicronema hongdechloris C2206]
MSATRRETLFFRGLYIEVFLRLTKYLDKMRKNPRWFLMAIAGRFGWIRSIVRKMANQANLQQHLSQSDASNFNEVNAVDIADTLKEDGLRLGVTLPDHILQEILEFAYSTSCYGNLNPRLGFLYSEKDELNCETTLFTAQYFNTSLLCPAIKTLAEDPKLVEIAARYLDADPIFTGSRLWWNFVVEDANPYDSNKTITFFHYDLDDYACLRFFFYLTDVDENGGPHVCVRGSHTNKTLPQILWPVKRRKDEDIIACYGSENVISILGPRGFGFAEDTFCYHKATRPLSQDRLILQIQFAIHNYGLHHDLKDPSLLKNIKE